MGVKLAFEHEGLSENSSVEDKFFCIIREVTHQSGRAVAQAVSRWLATATARVQTRV
jgi:predicted translin family RNA/ssDNA-binding protein